LREEIWKYDNVVDVYNVSLTDTVMDRTLEDVFRTYAHTAYTGTVFSRLVDETSVSVPDGGNHIFGIQTHNPVIDFKVPFIQGSEAGVIVRANSDPNIDSVRLGIVAGTGNPGTAYVVKRVYSGGVEQVGQRDYSPFVFSIKYNTPIPVRVTVRDTIYSVWIDGNYAGHFILDESLYQNIGLYAIGAYTIFTDVIIPELYEIPEFALLDTGISMESAIKKVVAQRRIKGVWTVDGNLWISYFSEHEDGPAYEDTLVASSPKENNNYLSRVTVEGAYTMATYISEAMAARGEHFLSVHLPDIMHREFCYKEAQAIVRKAAEEMYQIELSGLPDLRIDPEDKIAVHIARQNIDDDFYINDVSISHNTSGRQSVMNISVRQKIDV